MLVHVELPTLLKYDRWGLPGAYGHAYLEKEAHDRLIEADRTIRKDTKGKAQILVWDALRSWTTQCFLFDHECARYAVAHPDAGPEEVSRKVSEFVRPPRIDLSPPHCTGGAVDVTLLWDGADDTLGAFDDFTDFGRADYFHDHEPQNEDEAQTRARRSLLRSAMYQAGFVGIESEWWHYEWGTRTWATHRGEQVKLNTVVTPPTTATLAEHFPVLPPKQIVHVSGVALEFGRPETRARALRGETDDHYYARTRHPNERALACELANLVGAEDALLTCSGLNAVVTAVSGLMAPGGRLLIDTTAYYESLQSLRGVATAEGWTLDAVDFSDAAALEDAALRKFDVVFCDHPRNWMLTCPDLPLLRALSDRHRAKLIVDTSVQPLQRLLEQGLADLVVVSLSKYPSTGDTVAGAALGRAEDLAKPRARAKAHGLVLPPQAATTVRERLRFLSEHMDAVSAKAQALVAVLEANPLIAEVRLPDLSSVNAICGGQITCRFASPERARLVEAAVGWNAGRPDFPLALMCTFGAASTTFEHFDSRNIHGHEPAPGSDTIGPGWVRIGLGYEPLQTLKDALQLVLHAATEGDGPYDIYSVRPKTRVWQKPLEELWVNSR